MKKLKDKIVEKLLKSRVSAGKLAWSISIGMYLAFSPFIGIQTFLVFILAFVLRANAAIVFTVLYTVNNPWTLLPIAAIDYIFGHWLTESVFKVNLVPYDPSWMHWFNQKIGVYLTNYLGIEQLCFWCFMIGGNIIALFVAVVTFPFAKRFCANLIKKYNEQAKTAQ